MRSGIDTARQSADYRQSCVCQLIRELLCGFRAVVSGAPRTDDSNGMMIALLQLAPNVEHDRWCMDFAQRSRIRRGVLGDDARSKITNPFKLGGEIDCRFPVRNLICDFIPDAFHFAKLGAFCREDLLRFL